MRKGHRLGVVKMFILFFSGENSVLCKNDLELQRSLRVSFVKMLGIPIFPFPLLIRLTGFRLRAASYRRHSARGVGRAAATARAESGAIAESRARECPKLLGESLYTCRLHDSLRLPTHAHVAKIFAASNSCRCRKAAPYLSSLLCSCRLLGS